MPPAFVLSQNQTLKLMYDKLRRNRPKQAGISGSRSCTNSQSGVFAYLRHSFVPPGKPDRSHVKERHKFDRSYPEPRGPGRPGRRPHVPSSKPTMSKSRRASSPGSFGSGHRLYRPRRGAKRTPTPMRPRPLAGGAIYVEPSDASTGVLQFYCSSPARLTRSTVSDASR